ncbi:tyrosine-type recombinase/integrase [Ohessyouella blattaphilus]|uniref:Site-specific integrase n=1 Tax=Ohessyouella blattaphilus TaxID=2949333 RepID=A0ABT1EK59_9FIRM|nr:site-specific integrase [Ohessyouella blattaphilus]MCP1110869.1 site-specific integrase [Ohessyouella blattaphilus]MCR8564263.1 site-specific integrase [Ohessyouella blattaphilus]
MGKDLNGKKLPAGVMQRPNGIYRGRFKYNGDSYSVQNENLEDLIVALDELRYHVRRGLKESTKKSLMDEWFDLWLNIHKKRTIKERTRVRYHNFYSWYIKPRFGRKRIVDFSPILIESLLQDMADKEYSTSTIGEVFDLMRAIFRYALHNRIIVYNPCDGVELPKTKEKDIRVLTVKEQLEVLEHVKGRMYENLIILALNTGMRCGEMCGLTWDNIDFENRKIHVTKTLVQIKSLETGKYYFAFQEPKTKNSTRTIPMLDASYEVLKKQYVRIREMQMSASHWEHVKGFENLVFLTRSGKPVANCIIRNTLNTAEKSINRSRKAFAEKEGIPYVAIPHFYPHALRHTFATRCFEAGIDAKTVQGYLGHFSISITLDLYTHVTEEKAIIEMQKLEALYLGIG